MSGKVTRLTETELSEWFNNLSNGANIEFIFGGSFDPVHIGHINVIEKLRENCSDWPIRLLPCAVPALKNATSGNFEQRVNMLRIATEHIDNIVIDERENARMGISYTIDSLQDLTEEKYLTKFVLVIGMDTFKNMNQWHQWHHLKDYCHLLLVNRPGSSIENIDSEMRQLGFDCTKNVQKLELLSSGHYYCLNIEEKDISSTGIRSNLQRGLSVKSLVPSKVIDYIKKNLIYQKETLF